MMLQPLFYGLIILGYVISTFGYCLQVIFNDRGLGKIAFWVLLVGVVFQTALLVLQHLPPFHYFNHGEGDFYFAVSWLLGIGFLGIRQVRTWNFGIFLVPLAAILMIMAMSHPLAYHVGDKMSSNPWALIHFLFMSIAFAVFSVSFILGISFLLQRSALKSRNPGWISQYLPPLEVADEIHAKASTLGFLVLSAGMISGAILSKQTLGLFFTGDPRQIMALLVWLVYAIFLNVRLRSGWRGRKSILLALLGFLVVILAFLGIQHRI